MKPTARLSLFLLVACGGVGSGPDAGMDAGIIWIDAMGMDAQTNVPLDSYIDEPPVPPVDVPFASIAVAKGGGCGLRQGRDVVECWGRNDRGMNAFGEDSEYLARIGTGSIWVLDAPAEQLVMTPAFVCVVDSLGAVHCRGEGPDASPDFGGPVAALTAGDKLLCATMTSGALHCIGRRSYASEWSPSETAPFELGANVTNVAANLNTTCAALEDGRVACVGHGYADIEMMALPQPITFLAAQNDLTCGSGENGDLFCWSAFDRDELSQAPTIRRIANVNADELTAGANHMCARNMDGLRCWGVDPHGATGLGTVDEVAAPTFVDVGFPSPLVDVAAAASVTCALDERGEVRCWGDAKSVGTGFAFDIGDNEGETPARAHARLRDWRTRSLQRPACESAATYAPRGDVFALSRTIRGSSTALGVRSPDSVYIRVVDLATGELVGFGQAGQMRLTAELVAGQSLGLEVVDWTQVPEESECMAHAALRALERVQGPNPLWQGDRWFADTVIVRENADACDAWTELASSATGSREAYLNDLRQAVANDHRFAISRLHAFDSSISGTGIPGWTVRIVSHTRGDVLGDVRVDGNGRWELAVCGALADVGVIRMTIHAPPTAAADWFDDETAVPGWSGLHCAAGADGRGNPSDIFNLIFCDLIESGLGSPITNLPFDLYRYIAERRVEWPRDPREQADVPHVIDAAFHDGVLTAIEGTTMRRFETTQESAFWLPPTDLLVTSWARTRGPFEMTTDPIDAAWTEEGSVFVVRGSTRYRMNIEDGRWNSLPLDLRTNAEWTRPNAPFGPGSSCSSITAAWSRTTDDVDLRVIVCGTTRYAYDHNAGSWQTPFDLREGVWRDDGGPFETGSTVRAAWYVPRHNQLQIVSEDLVHTYDWSGTGWYTSNIAAP